MMTHGGLNQNSTSTNLEDNECDLKQKTRTYLILLCSERAPVILTRHKAGYI